MKADSRVEHEIDRRSESIRSNHQSHSHEQEEVTAEIHGAKGTSRTPSPSTRQTDIYANRKQCVHVWSDCRAPPTDRPDTNPAGIESLMSIGHTLLRDPSGDSAAGERPLPSDSARPSSNHDAPAQTMSHFPQQSVPPLAIQVENHVLVRVRFAVEDNSQALFAMGPDP